LEKVFIPDQYLGLSVDRPTVPDFVQQAAQENNLVEKPEVHISVVVTKNAMQMWRAIGSKKDSAALLKSVEALFKRHAWEYALTEEYFLHERTYSQTDLDLIENRYTNVPEHSRRTIVQKVQLPDLAIFYGKLNEMLGTSISVPVPHITLFAWSDYEPFKTRGIGINSAEEFERFTKKVLTR
jgi:hypothetical protein